MTWTAQQERALKAVGDWFSSGAEGRFYLGGYAGTGKTTLARHFAQTCGGRVRFAAFTGKAASVLREKGCPGATTIHSLIYRPKGSKGGREIQELTKLVEAEEAKPEKEQDRAKLETWKRDLARLREEEQGLFVKREDSDIMDCDLVVIDECSMVDVKMGKDLESFGKPILYLGDPGQLPPVGGRPHLRGEPDFVLEEIHRQAADSPIIWLANEVRQGRRASYGTFGDGLVEIARKSEFDLNRLLEADQVLTGMNVSRCKLNRAMRSAIGFKQIYPVVGDKLICRRNNHDEGLLNGVTCEVVADPVKRGAIIHLPLNYDNSERRLICDPGHFELNYGERQSNPNPDGVEHFDYGYAITGHKSQGSQWRSVVVCDDRMRVNDRAQRQKWLYTVITRAEEKLLIYV